MLYDMYLTMIRNNYNNVSGEKKTLKERISELKAIQKTLELIPMYCVQKGYITLGGQKHLIELIDSNLDMLEYVGEQ